MTEHVLHIGQDGDINKLFVVIENLGWKNQSRCNAAYEKFIPFGAFINTLTDEEILFLISVHEGIYGFINKPTPGMDRLNAMKWKI